MIVSEDKVWLIMSKDRKLVAKGTPRNRELVEVGGNDKKRYLTYASKRKAESAFKVSRFYGMHKLEGWDYTKSLDGFLEAVECDRVIRTV